jgi:hypothetical protein
MPDKTKCTNEDCPIKIRCLRYTSKPSEHQQAYQRFEPVKFELKNGHYWTCEHEIEIELTKD